MTTRSVLCFGLALLGSVLCGCDREEEQPASTSEPSESAPEQTPIEPEAAYPIIDQLAGCQLRHRGLSLDVGTEMASAKRSFRIGPFEDVVDVEREGSTFGRVMERIIDYDFWLETPVEDAFIEARLHGAKARRVGMLIDDRRLGARKLTEGKTEILSFGPIKGELSAGRHRLSLRFSARPRGSEDPYAELDWLRLGVPDSVTATYAAPTLENVVTDVVINGVPRRSVALRAPGALRCPVELAPDAALGVSLGFWGTGKGAVEVRLVEDDEETSTLLSRKLTGGGGATWAAVKVPMKDSGSRIAMLEMRATEATKGGRIVLGDPVLLRTGEAPKAVPKATTVIVIVASSIDRRRVPPWGPTGKLTGMGELARAGVAFGAYRVPTTVPPAVVASVLSGLPPTAHAMVDPAARIPGPVRLVSELVKESSGRTAMFTGVPTTSGTFGFEAGWDDFEAISPVKDEPASAPLERATAWLETELSEERAERRFVMVHLRGAHPPWDLTKEEAARLPPEEYGGLLDPRRGGIILARLRGRRAAHQRRLAEEDWIRLAALETESLAKQDEALRKLFALLKKKNEWDNSLIVLAGDVARGEGPEPPYHPTAPLAEDKLLVPLIVKFPTGALAGKQNDTRVTSVDVAVTVLRALRLEPPQQMTGRDLFQSASGVQSLAGRAYVATLGDRYATRFGRFRLAGQLGHVPELCAMDVDPACTEDLMDKKPLAAQAGWLWTYRALSRAADKKAVQREPASIDPATGAALTVWGDI